MGQLISKKPRLEINEADRAVLTLKTQARKLEQQRQRIQGNVDREMGIAASLVAQGKKDRALLALKRKKLQEGQLAKLDAYLLNVEEMLGNLELTKNQQRLMAALKQGNTAMKEMQQAMPLEEVEKLMQDSADAKEYEQSLRQLLGESLNPEEVEAAEEELHQLEQQLLDEHVLEMPRVPSSKEAAASAARQEQPAATAAGAAAAGAAEGGQQLEASLAELPSVPKTKVQPQQPVQAEAAAEQEEEPERVLVAT